MSTNAEKTKPAITKEQFFEYFNSDSYSEEMTPDECIYVFLTSLKGSSDITVELLEQLLNEYSLGLEGEIKIIQ